MRALHFFAAAALMAGAPLAAQPGPAAPGAPDYSRDASWLCLPGRADACSAPLRTTELGPGGFGATKSASPEKDPPLDCFYVYPTVSRDPGLNSDLDVAEEKDAAEVQFARFSNVCRTFAPIYRQMTLN